ncbi:MAG: hypothetical protein NTX26_02930 [Candidatus Parcubacteria bacterium]|nr:hypothetical protein [Candidatus Parcubacteria bacterium]
MRYRVFVTFVLVFVFVALGVLVQIETPQNHKASEYIALQQIEVSSNSKVTAIKADKVSYFKGIDFYPAPLPYESGEGSLSLDSLLESKTANFVGLRFFLREQDQTSTLVLYDVNQDVVLADIITRVHESGKGVCLEPQILVDAPGQFVANLKPKDIDLWFQSYTRAILHYAQFASDCGVEMFSIANENSSLWQYNSQWNKLLSAVNIIYDGFVTVRLNCWWQESAFNEVLDYSWLNHPSLDFIGISPYFDLTTKENPTIIDLENAWTNIQSNRHGINIVQELEAISKKYKKKIIFLEIGYRSIKNCAAEPWNAGDYVPRSSNSRIVYSDRDQAMAIRALYEVFDRKEWFAGAFWFYWPTAKPSKLDTTWSIWTKPSEEILRNAFAAHLVP